MTTHFHPARRITAAAACAGVVVSAGLTLALCAAVASDAAADTRDARPAVLVVAPAEFQPALGPWRAHREKAGWTVLVREPAAPGAVLREAHEAAGKRLAAVMLVGDVDRVPCGYRPVVATRKWESDVRIATDSVWGDLDGDEVPEFAVGRVPADSKEQASEYLARVVVHEGATDGADWMRRVEVIAGTGGFGAAQDLALEQITRQFLVKLVPPSFVVHATYGNPASAWCPPPAEMAQAAVDRINAGSLVVAYIGHGSPNELDKVKHGREKFAIFGDAELAKVDVKRAAPVMAFIACSTGRFDGERDCLAEDILRRPRGPVAVIASSRVSTPYSNGILSKELLDGMFAAKCATAGELIQRMKRRLVVPQSEALADPQRKDIERLAATFFDPSDEARAADRFEHVALYNLFGDPCLAIRRPKEVALEAPAVAAPGGEITVAGVAPFAGRAVVELAKRRDTPVRLGSRKSADEWRATYRTANAQEVATKAIDLPAGPFRVAVVVPADAPDGAYEVRLWIEGGAAGGRAVEVRAPR